MHSSHTLDQLDTCFDDTHAIANAGLLLTATLAGLRLEAPACSPAPTGNRRSPTPWRGRPARGTVEQLLALARGTGAARDRLEMEEVLPRVERGWHGRLAARRATAAGQGGGRPAARPGLDRGRHAGHGRAGRQRGRARGRHGHRAARAAPAGWPWRSATRARAWPGEPCAGLRPPRRRSGRPPDRARPGPLAGRGRRRAAPAPARRTAHRVRAPAPRRPVSRPRGHRLKAITTVWVRLCQSAPLWRTSTTPEALAASPPVPLPGSEVGRLP
jgi:hypothetical protein